MQLRRLWLTDFRGYETVDLELPNGVSVLAGANAQGKTSLLEAASWIASGRSFRGVTDAALVRGGTDQAIVRAELDVDGRLRLVEAEIRAQGRNRVLVDRKAIPRLADLATVARVTVFSPDDLDLVKEGPAGRREYLDDLLIVLAARYSAVRGDYDRVLRQRNALLRTGMRDRDASTTLDVFDVQLARAGAELAFGRLRLLERLVPLLGAAYDALAAADGALGVEYEAEWLEGTLTAGDTDDARLTDALAAAITSRRRAEIERGITLTGPHRDELRVTIGGLESRTQASQGEQRTLALALRIAGHRLSTQVHGSPPVLLLDDVFSELDERRATALVANLDAGQTLITTAGPLPPTVRAEQRFRVEHGKISEDS